MGQHVLCVIESDLDRLTDQLQFELAMHDRDWIPVDGMPAFYRHFDSEISDDLAIQQAEADLKTASEGLWNSPPEAVLAIA